jgi:hypothetical protein
MVQSGQPSTVYSMTPGLPCCDTRGSVAPSGQQGKVITPLFTYQTEAVQRLLQSRHNGAILVQYLPCPARKECSFEVACGGLEKSETRDAA